MRNLTLYLTLPNKNNKTKTEIEKLKFNLDIKTNTKLVLFIVDVIHHHHFVKTSDFSQFSDSFKFLQNTGIDQKIINFNYKPISIEINNFLQSDFEQQITELNNVIKTKNRSELVEILLHNYLTYVNKFNVYY